MKKYRILLMMSVVIMSLISCETVDFGETNDNHNGPSELNTGALLTAAQRRFVTVGGRPWLGNPNLYVQYRSQPSYSDPSRYAESAVDWQGLYVQTLINLQDIIEISQDELSNTMPAYTDNGSINNQMGIARIMKVLIFKRLTDSYGDIPYTEALAGLEIQSPAYTAQSEIYADFVTELQEARDMMDVNEAGPTGDIIYGGDVASWKKFANSLLLSVAMQMSDANESLAMSTFNEALSDANGVIEAVEEEAWYFPVNVSTLVNPWTSFRPADYNLSDYLTNSLQGVGDDYSNTARDSRIDIFSNEPDGTGLPYGLADYTGIGSSVKISLYLTAPESPFPWLTSSYVYLNRAEAAAKGWTSEDAEAMLEQGILNSYESISTYWGSLNYLSSNYVQSQGLTPVDITGDAAAFAAARLSDAGNVGIEQVIGEEKWAALFSQGFDAWSEFRRTGFPLLTPSPNPLNAGPIPTRYIYPNQEQSVNNGNWSSAVGNLLPAEDRNTSRIWWDVE
ncbi:SusD/RagB family nutrient-binding outer membrane lipoprotein [Robertkochia solimangrovi]|uniref:SusD/RagB family nutrient-binding outer membrane lipoprotein n=1 Tax=Robertkochia solimangrovi TaxID=2213046 RepID=UPI0013A57193|nr:SusD/RagB family nutrient-binding outer membrane lipoprotein [Robertkochia solimangrovi]